MGRYPLNLSKDALAKQAVGLHAIQFNFLMDATTQRWLKHQSLGAGIFVFLFETGRFRVRWQTRDEP